MPALGLDFGTTNTVFATLDGAGAPRAAVFEAGEGRAAAVRTALSFDATSKAGGGRGIEAGPWAIAAYLADPEETRFLQSLKTYAASPHFPGATLFARRYAFEDLAELVIARLRVRAGGQLDALPERLVVGVPVAFAGAAPDAALARRRYRAAFGRFGFAEVRFVYEPVAAAFWFARRLKRAATVLVADFGGGTTDYSLIRFEPGQSGARATPLAHAGVGVAGDQFDYRIVDRLVLPRLGKGSRYRSMGRTMEVPPSLFANFARWNLLSTFRGSADHRMLLDLIRDATEPDKLKLFAQLVEENEGYALYQAVSRAKTALSAADSARLTFRAHGIEIDAQVTRAEFESWIADDLARIEAALDVALTRAGIGPEAVDRVFLTGGTSFTPAVQRIFERRFGAARLERGEELLSIAHGLALIGTREDIAVWEAPEGGALS